MEKSKFKIGDKVKVNVDILDKSMINTIAMLTDLEEFKGLLVLDVFMCDYCSDPHLTVKDKKGNIENRIPMDWFLMEEEYDTIKH